MKLKVISTGSIGNAYLLETGQEALLIECGVRMPDIKKALDFNLSKVSGCLVSHIHGDHAKSVKDVLAAGINVYASQETLTGKEVAGHSRAHIIQSKQAFKVGNFRVLPFDVKHDVPCLGFLIEHTECGRVLFITDTYFCKYTFPGLNNIIIEANYSKEIIDKRFGPDSEMMFLRDRILKSHFSIANCKDMLAANDLTAVNNIVLIHLSDGNSNEAQFKKEVQELTGKNVTVARNRLEIPFGKYPF